MRNKKMSVLLTLAAVALLLLSVTPYLPWSHIATDLPSHFVLQYFLVAALISALIIAFFPQDMRLLPLLLIVLVMNGIQIRPYFCFSPPAVPAGAAPLKILQANVFRLTTDTKRLAALAQKENPDVIVLSEVTNIWKRALENEEFDNWPYRNIEPQDDTSYGMAVLSKMPFETFQSEDFTGQGIPTFFFKVAHAGTVYDIVSVHTRTPTVDLSDRDKDISEIAAWHRDAKPAHAVIVGDFNATPWAPAMKKMMQETGLKNAREGFRLNTTWPMFLPVFLRLPIDHALVSGVTVTDFRKADDIGSDHLPTVTVVVPEK